MKLEKIFNDKNIVYWISFFLLLTVIAPWLFTIKLGIIDLSSTSQANIGQTIGGVTAPITAILSAILLFYTFRSQKEETRNNQANQDIQALLTVINQEVATILAIQDKEGNKGIQAVKNALFYPSVQIEQTELQTFIYAVKSVSGYAEQLLGARYTTFTHQALKQVQEKLKAIEKNLLSDIYKIVESKEKSLNKSSQNHDKSSIRINENALYEYLSELHGIIINNYNTLNNSNEIDKLNNKWELVKKTPEIIISEEQMSKATEDFLTKWKEEKMYECLETIKKASK